MKLKPVSQILFIILFGVFVSYIFNKFPLQSFFFKILFLIIIAAVFFRFFTYETLLYSTIFLIPYNLYLYDIIGQYTISYLQVLWLLTFIKFLRKYTKYKRENIFPSITLPVLFFVLFMFLSLLWTQDKVCAFKIALRWGLPIFFLFFGYCSDKKIRKNIIKVIVISGILLSLIAVAQWIWGMKSEGISHGTFIKLVSESRVMHMFVDHDRLQDEKTNWWISNGVRAFGTFANANNLAGFFGLVFYLIYSFKNHIRENRTVLLFLLAVFIGFIILLTGSVAGIVAFSISFAVFLFFQEEKNWKKFSIFSTAVFLIIILLYSNIGNIRGLKRVKGSWAWRMEAWPKAVKFSFQHPFGSGLGGYPDVVPHNIFLLVGVFLGFIGLALFIWMIVRIFYEGIKIYRKSEDIFAKNIILSILCGFLWFFIHAQADNIFINNNIGMLFWLEVGLLLSFEKKRCRLPEEL